MATPINVSISESVDLSEALAVTTAVQKRISFSESVALTESVATQWPTAPRMSDQVPVADDIAVDLPQYSTRKLVVQTLVSSFEYVSPLATYFISAETALGVIPQIGSATYEKWEHRKIKEVDISRFMHSATANPEESGRERLSGLRNFWSLTQNLKPTEADLLWTFISTHVGSGTPFYFYDLQNNNFQYDATGALADGRYLVRFVSDTFSKEQYIGSRSHAFFRFSYDLIEVGA